MWNRISILIDVKQKAQTHMGFKWFRNDWIFLSFEERIWRLEILTVIYLRWMNIFPVDVVFIKPRAWFYFDTPLRLIPVNYAGANNKLIQSTGTTVYFSSRPSFNHLGNMY